MSSTPHIGAQAFIGIDDLGEVGLENGSCFALENAVERGWRQASRSFEELVDFSMTKYGRDAVSGLVLPFS